MEDENGEARLRKEERSRLQNFSFRLGEFCGSELIESLLQRKEWHNLNMNYHQTYNRPGEA